MTWVVLLAGFGLALIVLEIFLPGAVLGIVGSLFLLAATIVAFIQFGFRGGYLTLTLLMVVCAVAILVWIRIFPKTFAGKALITNTDLSDSKTADTSGELMGQKGVALTQLRPSGTAMISHRRIDVMAESGFIEKDSPVEVIRVSGSEVVVRLASTT